MRRIGLAVAIIGGLGASGVLLRAAILSGEVTILDRPSKSIGVIVDEADAVVAVTFEEVAEPRWNSPDGTDWSNAYESNPGNFVTVPMKVTRMVARVDHVIASRAQGSWKVEEGDRIEVYSAGDPRLTSIPSSDRQELGKAQEARFVDRDVQRVLFLKRGHFPYSDGREAPVWRVDPYWTIWGLEASRTWPGSFEHNSSLESADDRGDLEVTQVDGIARAVDLAELERLIGREWKTPNRDWASYQRWPARGTN